MKLLFAGTPEIAKILLEALGHSSHTIMAVLTQPDRPAGRGQKLQESPVKQWALQQALPVFQPSSLQDPSIRETLAAFSADLMIVVAYGLIIPPWLLDLPSYGCWNVHVSLLPRWRGAAPIQRAIEAGDAETGVSIMQMDAGLDTGPLLLQKKISIDPQDTSQSLHQRLAVLGAEALLEALDQCEQGHLIVQPQAADGVTYAKKISKEEARLDFNEGAVVLERKVRAFYPWPMAFMEYQGEVFKIKKARVVDLQSVGVAGEIVKVSPEGIVIQTSKGCLCIETLQQAGGKALSVREFLNGHNDYFIEGRQCSRH